ncbi:GDP-mannose 4,6-dehydratase [Nocardioides sp. AN3]
MTDLTERVALVIGGAGFVGSWLCERLLDEGASVWCVDPLVTGSRDKVQHLVDRPGFTLVEADVSQGVPDPGDVDLVMNLVSASPGHDRRLPLETLTVASAGTMHALELAERHRARFVLASMCNVNGDPRLYPHRYPQQERDEAEALRDATGVRDVDRIARRGVDDEGMRFAEATTMAFHRAHGVDVSIARIFGTYGPRMSFEDGWVVPTFLTQALSGDPLTVPGDGSQTRSLCWVEDAVDGLVRLARSGERGPVNLGNDTQTTLLELARMIIELAGSRSPIRHVELPEDDAKATLLDLGFAHRALGWVPTMSVEEGLKRMVGWMEETLTG